MYNSLQIGDDKLWYVLVVLRSFRLKYLINIYKNKESSAILFR